MRCQLELGSCLCGPGCMEAPASPGTQRSAAHLSNCHHTPHTSFTRMSLLGERTKVLRNCCASVFYTHAEPQGEWHDMVAGRPSVEHIFVALERTHVHLQTWEVFLSCASQADQTRAETPGRPCRPIRRHPKGHTLTSRGNSSRAALLQPLLLQQCTGSPEAILHSVAGYEVADVFVYFT